MTTDVLHLVPGPENWNVRWNEIESAFPEVAAMRGTPHDPVFHAEGCPLVHTRMVCEAMAASQSFRNLDDEGRSVAFLTAVLHDIAKPVTAREENGRVSHPGHSRIGAIMARKALWERDVPPRLRERVCSSIAGHQVPFWLFEREWSDIRRFVVGASLTCGNDVLSTQAHADALGRIAPDVDGMVERVELFRLAAEETGCLNEAYPTADGTTLRAYMSSPETIDPSYPLPRPAGRPVATVMSGLPGTGKSTWLARNLPSVPVVSLDAVRDHLGVDPAETQGSVVAFARELARKFLREGKDFAWDGTNLTRDVRDSILGLCRSYGFTTRIVVTEATPRQMQHRFSARGRAVPAKAIDRMLRRWDHPAPWEADEVVGEGFRHFHITPAGPSPITNI